MNTLSRTITGGVGIIIAIALLLVGIRVNIVLVYAIPILIISIVLFFNKKEDKIEQIKPEQKRGKKK